MMSNLVLSKQWFDETFIDLSLNCQLELEDWNRAKQTLYWNRPKRCSVSESLLWALILDLCQRHRDGTDGESARLPATRAWSRQRLTVTLPMTRMTNFSRHRAGPPAGARRHGPLRLTEPDAPCRCRSPWRPQACQCRVPGLNAGVGTRMLTGWQYASGYSLLGKPEVLSQVFLVYQVKGR